MLRKILIGLGILVAILAIAFAALIYTGPSLPADADEVIAEVMANELPNMETGKAATTKSGDVTIWYEVFNDIDTAKGTILLIMGHSSSAITWTANFYSKFIAAGYRVIRYDNRGLGRSSWMENWTKENAYTLEDMADDAIAILDAESIEKAHVVGASMGGMIVQSLGINHADRMASLTSIMSSGYFNDPDLTNVPFGFARGFLKYQFKYKPTDELNMLKLRLGVRGLLKGKGDYEFETKPVIERALYEIKKRKGYNPTVGDQHSAAIEKSGSRYDQLSKITTPTLLIHGKTDPLIFFEHAEKYAPMIPDATTLFLDGMGHDIPTIYIDEITGKVIEMANGVNL